MNTGLFIKSQQIQHFIYFIITNRTPSKVICWWGLGWGEKRKGKYHKRFFWSVSKSHICTSSNTVKNTHKIKQTKHKPKTSASDPKICEQKVKNAFS